MQPPEEICDNLFRLRIPLPETPLGYLNTYVVKSDDRHLVVDVGFNLSACRAAITSGLAMLDVALEETDFFITHMHADHLGLLPELAEPSATVYFSKPEARLLRQWKGPGDLIDFSTRHGFPSRRIEQAFSAHPASSLRIDRLPTPVLVNDGDIIHLKHYRFRCIHTPGHTPGHMCLYEPERRILIAGDHLLDGISPNVVCWSDAENPLKHYLESLEKVAALDVDIVLPGHRRIFHNHRRRVAELMAHHAHRLMEARNIIASRGMNAFRVAGKIGWDFGNGHWDAFPVTQQWFAFGEALAHLRYLEEFEIVNRVVVDNIAVFKPVSSSSSIHVQFA